ncbi:EAL domain-containing protein [Acholeplasma granularum]|uniref:EAL domain-containing protein n=1 Tax=Acholeplasma granularum TaxID=264635 RepID=UPI00046FECA0|nr:EAL domain-containing protein [Acholeplasma granularum]
MQLKNMHVKKENIKRIYFKIALNILIIILIGVIVYMTGGVRNSFTHLMYIPIILASATLNMYLTIGISVFAGLILGPFMPQDTFANISQEITGWLFRLTMFIIIGAVASFLNLRIKNLQRVEIERSFKNSLTKYPNLNKMKFDLDYFIKNDIPFYLLAFRIENINTIKQNINYDIGTKILIKILKELDSISNGSVYSVNSSEVSMILVDISYEEALKIGNEFLKSSTKLFDIDEFKLGLLISGSILSYPKNFNDSLDAIKKSAIILDNAKNDFVLYEYNETMLTKGKIQAELVPDILEAIKNDEFFLQFQPKVCLKNEPNYGVEALLRWHHPTKGLISPSVFIPVAEETGLITEITKIVIKKVIEQKQIWKKNGLNIVTSINLSPKDFNSKEFINYLIDILSDKDIDISLIELEITERAVLEQTEMLIPLFDYIRGKGIKISIDDFGTGYNSLIHLVKIPMDYLKIDKSFIDYILEEKYFVMIKHLINVAHNIGVKVIAEGVETKEQYDILKQFGCDFIQGYYLSKPLSPNQVEAFYNGM